MKVEIAPQGFFAVTIGTESLLCLGPEKEVSIRIRRYGRVWIVTGQTGNLSRRRIVPLFVQGRHISGLSGREAIVERYLRMCGWVGYVGLCTFALTMTGGAVTNAEVVFASVPMGPGVCGSRRRMDQVTCAAGAGFSGRFFAVVFGIGCRYAQIVRRRHHVADVRMTTQAEFGILPRGS